MTIIQRIATNLTAWMDASTDHDTIDKVAAKSGVGFGTVRRIKKGEGNPTVTNIDDIAKVFGKGAADLLKVESYAPTQTVSHLAIQESATGYTHPDPLIARMVALMESTDDAGRGIILGAAHTALSTLRPTKQNAA